MYPYLDFISLIVCSLCLFLYCFEAAIERSGIQKFEKYILELQSFETKEIVNGEEKSRLIFFSKHKRKILYNLIFKPLPVEKNYPETIMSAVENNGNKAIKDGSISYKAQSYIRKILTLNFEGQFYNFEQPQYYLI